MTCSSIDLHLCFIDCPDKKRICQRILRDKIDLALKKPLEFFGEEEEVVGIVAVIHRFFKGDEQVDVTGGGEAVCADRAEGEDGFDLAVGAQRSDLVNVVVDDPVYSEHDLRFGYGLLGYFTSEVVVTCLVEIV